MISVKNQKGGKEIKANIFRSGEKGFEEEKRKMFQPRMLNWVHKEERLRLAFNHLLHSLLVDYYMSLIVDEDKLIEKYTNIFMREIKTGFHLED